MNHHLDAYKYERISQRYVSINRNLSCYTDSQRFSVKPKLKMNALFIILLVALTMEDRLVPSMATTAAHAQTRLATISYSLGAMVSTMHANVKPVSAWKRRRRGRWGVYWRNKWISVERALDTTMECQVASLLFLRYLFLCSSLKVGIFLSGKLMKKTVSLYPDSFLIFLLADLEVFILAAMFSSL